MDRILIILKTNGPRASFAPAICSRSQVSVYRTIGPLVNINVPFSPFLDLVKPDSRVLMYILYLL